MKTNSEQLKNMKYTIDEIKDDIEKLKKVKLFINSLEK